jgi:hypothetical protein
MNSANEKVNVHLATDFTNLGKESKISSNGALSILIKWDISINNKMSISNAENNNIDILIKEFEKEHQQFRVLLLEEMINRQSDLDKHQLIEMVFVYLIRIMDTIFEFTKGIHLAEPEKTVVEKICLHFQQTFGFIQEFFGSFISREQKAPAKFIEISKVEITRKLKKVKADFSTTPDTESPLIDKVISVIKDKVSVSSTLSINSIDYINLLAGEIYRHVKTSQEQNLRTVLYSLNFNEENFVMAEYERFASLSPDTLSKSERIRLLKREQKAINQVVVRLNCYWDFDMPSLKEQLNGWLNEEIQFIDSGMTATLNQVGAVASYDKIQTSLSVAKLALIVRLLVIDKIIINRQVAPVLRTITKVFSTLQKDEVSFGSLETKYHAPEKTTITIVRDMLFKWINILGKL